MQQFHQASMPSSSSDSRPAAWMVAATAIGAVVAMAAALFFAGQEQTPIALFGTAAFVLLGGLAFDMARRRSR
jgi:anti-sigma-K factor RskA